MQPFLCGFQSAPRAQRSRPMPRGATVSKMETTTPHYTGCAFSKVRPTAAPMPRLAHSILAQSILYCVWTLSSSVAGMPSASSNISASPGETVLLPQTISFRTAFCIPVISASPLRLIPRAVISSFIKSPACVASYGRALPKSNLFIGGRCFELLLFQIEALAYVFRKGSDIYKERARVSYI